MLLKRCCSPAKLGASDAINVTEKKSHSVMQRQDSAHMLLLINFDIYTKLFQCMQDVEITIWKCLSVGESGVRCVSAVSIKN